MEEAQQLPQREAEEEVKQLLSGFHELLLQCSCQLNRQFVATRGELTQVQGLLAESFAVLTSSFKGLHAYGEAQRKTIQALQSQDCMPRATAGQLDGSAAEIDSLVTEAVTALQVEDIVAQLNTHIVQRVNALEEVARQLASCSSGVMTFAGVSRASDANTVLDSLRQKQADILSALNDLDAKTVHNSVEQKALADGDVEIF